MSTTTGPYPSQMVLAYNATIGDSFSQELPYYSYDGTSHACSEGGTITQQTDPPLFAIQRAAQVPIAAQGNAPLGNLWQDKGNRYIQQTIDDMKQRWIVLQPIWASIKQAYDNAYTPVYNSMAGNQAPGNINQTVWNSMNQQQRALTAERLAEEAGKREVQRWVAQAEGQLLTHFQGPLAASQLIAVAWGYWKINYQLEQEHVYKKEHAAKHTNESDVVRTAGMYLVYPVLAALNSDPTMYNTIGLQSEDSHNQVRSDITFYRGATNGNNRPIAILEFKRRGVIKPSHFRDAIIQGATTANLNQQQPGQPNGTTRLQYAINLSRTKRNGTFFELNDGFRLMRQASCYAKQYGTRHVALCDWNYLVLCYFMDMPYPTQGIHHPVGNCVEIQVLRIGTPIASDLRFQDAIGSELFRPALLGFLKDAYDRTP